MIKILVTGAGGQLAGELKEVAKQFDGMEFRFFNRQELDILNEKALEQISGKFQPDILINCAAYTAVDKAEQEQDLCYRINTAACQALVNVFEGSLTKIIHFSSDYVYHTCAGQPLTEDCPTEPQSIYAKTKLEGEKILIESDVPSLIIRTSWVYAPSGTNFLQNMLRLAESKDVLSVVYDQIGTPTYAMDLAKATLSIIQEVYEHPEKLSEFNTVYNYSNEGVTSWYDFATFIFKMTGQKTLVRPITSNQYPTLAKRPNWSLMSKNKIKEAFNLDIPHWYDALGRCLNRMNIVRN